MQSPDLPHATARPEEPGLSFLETSGALSAGLVHDLNNQISAIVGNAEYAAHVAPSDERLARALESIRTASNRAGKLLAQYGQFRRRIGDHTRICPTAEVALAIQENLPPASGWRIHIPDGLTGCVRIQPDWFARMIAQVLSDTGSRAGRVDIAEGPLERPWPWRGSPVGAGVFQVFVSCRSSQPLFGEDGPLQPDVPGAVAAWELMRSFRGQINARVSGPDQQEIAILLPMV